MKRYVEVYPLMEFANNMKDKSIDANDIARFPLADVRENVHGRWVEINVIDYKALCSVCGEWSSIMGNFCPNCGAQVDERKGDG